MVSISGSMTARNTPSAAQRRGASFDGGFRGGGSLLAGAGSPLALSSISLGLDGGVDSIGFSREGASFGRSVCVCGVLCVCVCVCVSEH